MGMKIGKILIEATIGNIASQPDITAIVNAANAELRIGGGVAGAIHGTAGPGLVEECRQYAPIRPGDAVITGAHYLPNQYVIHCLGPVFGIDHPEDILLANCYRNAILRSEEKQIDSIAFPAISTGAFGFPFEAATDIALSAIQEVCPHTKYLRLVRFVLFSPADLEVYQKKIKSISSA